MIISRFFSAKFSKTYRDKREIRLMWDTYAVSSFHAPFSAVMAFLSLTVFSEDEANIDVKSYI